MPRLHEIHVALRIKKRLFDMHFGIVLSLVSYGSDLRGQQSLAGLQVTCPLRPAWRMPSAGRRHN